MKISMEEQTMNNQFDKKINNKLFSIDRFKVGLEYEQELKKAHELSRVAKSLIMEYGDKIVFDSWFEYLKYNVNSQKDAWNFMMSFFDYDGYKLKVENPYPFLGMLYKKLGLSLDKDPEGYDENQMNDTFDSIYIELLVSSGIVKYDDYFNMNPYYDERLRKAYEES